MPDLVSDDERLKRIQALTQIQMPNAPAASPVPTAPNIPSTPTAMQPPLRPIGGAPQATPQKPPPMVGSSEDYGNQIQAMRDKQNDPWGSPDNHPGALGKLGHVLGRVGNIAGDIVAPATMSLIPGTDLNNNIKEHALENKQAGAKKQEDTEALQQSEIGRNKAETDKLETETSAPKVPKDAFELWAQQNPNGTIADWKKASAPEEKAGEFKPFTVDGKTTYGQQVGNKIFDPSGQDITSKAQPFEKPAEERPQSGTLNGKPSFALYDQSKGWLDAETKQPIKGFRPAPNFAEIAPGLTAQKQQTQTKVMFGPDGKPQDFSWNPKSGRYDIPQGYSASGAAGGREAQANIIGVAGANMIHDIEAHKEHLGDLTAWYKSHTLNVPYMGDPEIAEIDSELRSFAALQPAMHGFRSTSALDTFEKIIGGVEKDPDTTISSIRGILKTAVSMGTGDGQPQGGAKKPPPF